MNKEKMNDKEKAAFTGGRNIAMKVPSHQWERTVAFYRDVIGLRELESKFTSTALFAFGSNNLWIDKVDSISQAEIWLELAVDDTQAAAKLLDAAGVVRCYEIEPLPEDLDGFWIANPASIIHLVANKEDKNY